MSLPIYFWLEANAKITATALGRVRVPDIRARDEDILRNLAAMIEIKDADGNLLYWHIQRRTTALDPAFATFLEGLRLITSPDEFPSSESEVREVKPDASTVRVRRSFKDIAKRHSFGEIKQRSITTRTR